MRFIGAVCFPVFPADNKIIYNRDAINLLTRPSFLTKEKGLYLPGSEILSELCFQIKSEHVMTTKFKFALALTPMAELISLKIYINCFY